MGFCGDRALIAHNIRFDYDILNSNLIRAGMRPYQNDQVACSLAFAKEQMIAGKLSDLATHYRVSIKDSDLHRALYDVHILTDVMNKMMKKYEPENLQYSLIL
jgi:DNA polymerase III epsilon subunit-like protein